MKRTCCTIICLAALALNSALGQHPLAPPPGPGPQPPSGTPDSAGFQSRLQNIISQANKPTPEPTLTRFNLDFPGGWPKDLVAAIEKATGRPLNAIIPDEFTDTHLPALKMDNVTIPQLFQALEAASRKNEAFRDNNGNERFFNTCCGFKTESNQSEDSIWHFYVERPVFPPSAPPDKACRFYSLAPYLDGGFSVDDITTAIETGWKMMGEMNPPTIRFHKDTKLLIAVGQERKLNTINDVLRALTLPKPKTTAPTPAPAAK